MLQGQCLLVLVTTLLVIYLLRWPLLNKWHVFEYFEMLRIWDFFR